MMMSETAIVVIGLIILVVVAAIVFLPILELWCIYTIWDVEPVYDFWHWLAAFLMGAVGVGSGLFRINIGGK